MDLSSCCVLKVLFPMSCFYPWCVLAWSLVFRCQSWFVCSGLCCSLSGSHVFPSCLLCEGLIVFTCSRLSPLCHLRVIVVSVCISVGFSLLSVHLCSVCPSSSPLFSVGSSDWSFVSEPSDIFDLFFDLLLFFLFFNLPVFSLIRSLNSSSAILRLMSALALISNWQQVKETHKRNAGRWRGEDEEQVGKQGKQGKTTGETSLTKNNNDSNWNTESITDQSASNSRMLKFHGQSKSELACF